MRLLLNRILSIVYAQTQLKLPDDLRKQIFDQVLNDLLGFGPIQSLLDEDDVSEIMVNGPKKVFVEKKGQLTKTNITFDDDDHVLRIIDRIILPLGRRVDADSPTVDARLPDGSRVNAVVRPVAIDGPSITIRKFTKDKLQVEDLINFGSLTKQMAEFLQACVKARFNIIISGGTGSGKTTLLNVMSGFIPENERIITIEDAAELQLQQDHVMRMETKVANADGLHAVSIRELVKNSLRMRPDRIVVGEVRGGEALDMLQAMNTGHDGSLTTVHANTPRDAISRIETLVLMAGMDLPLKVVRQQVSSAVDLIVQQTRLKDGQRKVTAVTEVAGMEGDVIVLSDIFKFNQKGVTTDGKVLGEISATGIRPNFTPRLEAAGFKLSAEIFAPKAPPIRTRGVETLCYNSDIHPLRGNMNNAQITIREKKLGLLIRDARMAERRSIKECADAIGVKPGMFRAYEEGRRAPSLPELETLVFYLKLPITQFWGRETRSDSIFVESVDIARLIALRQRMIGALLRQERNNVNMSIRHLSTETGNYTGALKAYELGERAIPVPELETILAVMGSRIEIFFDQNGPVGQWMTSQRAMQKFLELPEEMQNFVCQPVNRPYLELAMKLSDMSREKLRAVAEGLLDITL